LFVCQLTLLTSLGDDVVDLIERGESSLSRRLEQGACCPHVLQTPSPECPFQ
jgi:hypothetical protein